MDIEQITADIEAYADQEFDKKRQEFRQEEAMLNRAVDTAVKIIIPLQACCSYCVWQKCCDDERANCARGIKEYLLRGGETE